VKHIGKKKRIFYTSAKLTKPILARPLKLLNWKEFIGNIRITIQQKKKIFQLQQLNLFIKQYNYFVQRNFQEHIPHVVTCISRAAIYINITFM
jgi:hypothetical protein